MATKVAQEGINVYLKEVSAEAVESAQRELERSLDHSIERLYVLRHFILRYSDTAEAKDEEGKRWPEHRGDRKVYFQNLWRLAGEAAEARPS